MQHVGAGARAGRAESGYRGYPQPQPAFGATARSASKKRSDIHGFSRTVQPLPPALPRPKDPGLHGGQGPQSGIYGYQSAQLRDASKVYEQARQRSPRMTSFNKYEQARTRGHALQPPIKNQGNFQPGPKRLDPNLHGGNSAGQRPAFLGAATPSPANPRRVSWTKQERNLEDSLGLPIMTSPRARRGLPPTTSSEVRYFRPTSFDNRTTSRPQDAPTYKRDGTVKKYDPKCTASIHGYSSYIREHHERAVQPNRTRPTLDRSYRDFDGQSRNQYRRLARQREAQMRQLAAAPVPAPSAMMGRTYSLQPVAPMGIYQWPRARRWGHSSMGYAGTALSAER